MCLSIIIIIIIIIAGNFRAVQNFAFFADRSRSAKIKTQKIFFMRMRKGEGGSTLRTAGTGLKRALYRYATSHQQANRQSSRPQGTAMKENARVRCTHARGARGQGMKWVWFHKAQARK